MSELWYKYVMYSVVLNCDGLKFRTASREGDVYTIVWF